MSAYAFTDDNVPLKCMECNEYLEGIKEVINHLMLDHAEYTEEDAKKFSQIWIKQAHDDQREQLANYREERKIDEVIERDAFPNK